MASFFSFSLETTPSRTTRPALTTVSTRVELNPLVPMRLERRRVAVMKSLSLLFFSENQCAETERTRLSFLARAMAFAR